MVSGTYTISLKMPRGTERGLLVLEEADGALRGYIRTKGRVSRFAGGRCGPGEREGEARFSFQGILSFGLIKISYAARGTVQGDLLKAAADTRYGSFPLEGRRMRPPQEKDAP
ncbi:MAG TPA: hypothetical protein H9684_05745 [Firmicutes bacterium]|nr:hypothetical protein [Bacillota bacterium]